MAQTFDREYYAQKQRESRALDKYIQTYHAWQRMPGEPYKDFKKRMTKRIVVVMNGDTRVILDPFGNPVSL